MDLEDRESIISGSDRDDTEGFDKELPPSYHKVCCCYQYKCVKCSPVVWVSCPPPPPCHPTPPCPPPPCHPTPPCPPPVFGCDGSFDITQGVVGCPNGVYICIRKCNELYSISVSISSPQTTFNSTMPIALVYTVTNTGNVPLPAGTSFLFQHNKVNTGLQQVLVAPLAPGTSTSYTDTYTPTSADLNLSFIKFTLQGWATLQFTLPCVTSASVYDIDESGVTLVRVN